MQPAALRSAGTFERPHARPVRRAPSTHFVVAALVLGARFSQSVVRDANRPRISHDSRVTGRHLSHTCTQCGHSSLLQRFVCRAQSLCANRQCFLASPNTPCTAEWDGTKHGYQNVTSVCPTPRCDPVVLGPQQSRLKNTSMLHSPSAHTQLGFHGAQHEKTLAPVALQSSQGLDWDGKGF